MIDVMGIKKKKEKDLTLRGHLIELRQRLIWSVIAVAITTIVCFVFGNRIIDFFQSRAPEDIEFVAIQVTEKVVTYMKVCLYGGVALALPFLVYQLVMFIHPALTSKEKKYLYLLMPGVALFFAAGVAFAYFVFLPTALDFLLKGPWVSDVEARPSIGNYISLITRMLVATGLIFQIPLLIYFLSRIGVINPQWLSKFRKFAFVGAFIISAIVTPTPDPINQTIVAIPILLLYEIGVLLSKLAWRQRGSPVESQA